VVTYETISMFKRSKIVNVCNYRLRLTLTSWRETSWKVQIVKVDILEVSRPRCVHTHARTPPLRVAFIFIEMRPILPLHRVMCVIVGSLMIYSRRSVMSSRFLYNSTPLNPSRRIVFLQNLTAKPSPIIIRTSFVFV